MTKTEFVTKVKETRREFEEAVAGLSPAQIVQPATCGSWSVKDVIAHVTWHERQMVGVLRARALVGSELWNLPLAQRNAAIYRAHWDNSADLVLSEFRRVYEELLPLLEGLTDEDLVDPTHFRQMPAEWIPWHVIGSNTFDHYPAHTEAIRKAFPGDAGTS